jgi:hypothetical protein
MIILLWHRDGLVLCRASLYIRGYNKNKISLASSDFPLHAASYCLVLGQLLL